MTKIDRQDLIDFLKPMLPDLMQSKFPNARPDGNGWRLGDLFGVPGSSLSISKSGQFYDHADPDTKGTIIDLYAKMFGLADKNILKAVAEHSGFMQKTSQPNPKGRDKLVETYEYLDSDGNLLFKIGRFCSFDTNGNVIRKNNTGKPGKSFRPISKQGKVCSLPAGLKDIRPLYNLPKIVENDLVVVVEGEKAADALTQKGYCCTTWHGGTGCHPRKVDWSPLKDKRVVLWPDNDDLGRSHMQNVAEALRSVAREIRVVTIPELLPETGDAVEAINLGLIIDEIITSAQPFDTRPAAKHLDFSERPAPEFNCSLLGHAEGWVVRFANQLNCPPDYVAAPLFAAVSALCGKVFSVDVNGAGWTLPVNLWTWSIGAPGTGKSPPASPIMKVLFDIEEEWRKEHEAKIEAELASAKDKLASLDSKEQTKKREFEEEIERLKDKLKRPPRLIVTDITREKLASIEERAYRGTVSTTTSLPVGFRE